MFEYISRPVGQPWGTLCASSLANGATCSEMPASTRGEPVILAMRENRSHLPEAGRQTLAVLAVAFLALTILPALHGHWLVPVYSLATLAALTLAIERRGRTPPRREVLEFWPGRVCHRDSQGQVTELPSQFLRLAAEERRLCECRLFLRARERSVEIGLCLGAEERRAIAPAIAAALSQSMRP